MLVDDFQDPTSRAVLLLRLLAAEHGDVAAAGDDDQAIQRFRGAATKNLRDFARRAPDATVVRLERVAALPASASSTRPRPSSRRSPDRIAKQLEPATRRRRRRASGAAPTSAPRPRAWPPTSSASSPARASRPERIGVLVRSVRNEGQAVAVALEERAVPYRLVGAAAFFQRAEVRDVLAWLRLLADPGDAGAVVRALARPPVELRSVDLARCIQIARRRKLDMVSALVAATESPQLPPEARERILALPASCTGGRRRSSTPSRPDLFVHRLIERLGLRRQQLFAAQADVVERLVNLAKLRRARHARTCAARRRRRRASSPATSPPSPRPGCSEEEASVRRTAPAVQVMTMHAAKGLEFDHVYVLGLQSSRMPGARRRTFEPIPDALLQEELPPDTRAAHLAEMRRLLHVAMTRARRAARARLPRALRGGRGPAALAVRRGGAQRAGRRVGGARGGALRPGRDPARRPFAGAARRGARRGLGASAAGWASCGSTPTSTSPTPSSATSSCSSSARSSQRPRGPDRRGGAAGHQRRACARRLSPDQREIFETSTLDDFLLGADADERRRAAALTARAEPSLEAFLPRRGAGLVLSASDIETYRTCPLKYKFARVFRIPQEPTVNQRFGILVHQVLERYHGETTPPARRRPWPSCSACSTRAGAAAASATPTRSASCAPRRSRR